MTGAGLAIAALRHGYLRGRLVAGALALVALPALVLAGVAGLIASEVERSCEGASVAGGEQPAGGGPLGQGLYATPLQLRPGRSYEVGATSYGGPGDPGSGDYGSIPLPGQSYLPAHPDSFAELSLLRVNPANGGTFTFANANALSNLPYLTALRVAHSGR
jgi:hypothetical protein